MKSVEVAVINPKTGLPERDAGGEIVTQKVNPETGEPVGKRGSGAPSASGSASGPAGDDTAEAAPAQKASKKRAKGGAA